MSQETSFNRVGTVITVLLVLSPFWMGFRGEGEGRMPSCRESAESRSGGGRIPMSGERGPESYVGGSEPYEGGPESYGRGVPAEKAVLGVYDPARGELPYALVELNRQTDEAIRERELFGDKAPYNASKGMVRFGDPLRDGRVPRISFDRAPQLPAYERRAILSTLDPERRTPSLTARDYERMFQQSRTVELPHVSNIARDGAINEHDLEALLRRHDGRPLILIAHTTYINDEPSLVLGDNEFMRYSDFGTIAERCHARVVLLTCYDIQLPMERATAIATFAGKEAARALRSLGSYDWDQIVRYMERQGERYIAGLQIKRTIAIATGVAAIVVEGLPFAMSSTPDSSHTLRPLRLQRLDIHPDTTNIRSNTEPDSSNVPAR